MVVRHRNRSFVLFCRHFYALILSPIGFSQFFIRISELQAPFERINLFERKYLEIDIGLWHFLSQLLLFPNDHHSHHINLFSCNNRKRRRMLLRYSPIYVLENILDISYHHHPCSAYPAHVKSSNNCKAHCQIMNYLSHILINALKKMHAHERLLREGRASSSTLRN